MFKFKHLEYFYFHNCLYEGVWRDNQRRWNDQTPTWDILRTYGSGYKCIFVGDASMSPYEVAYTGGVDTAILAITGFGPHDIFVVGDEGYALRYDGLQWRAMHTGTPFELYEIWGYDSEHVLAVGGGGTVMRWNGDNWQSFNATTDNDFYGVWGDSLNRIFIDGLSGTLVRFSGQKWGKEFSGNRSDLHALTGKAGGPVFAVGSLGTILRNDLNNDDDLWELEESPTTTTLRALAHSDDAVYAVGSHGLLMRRQW